MAKSTVTPESNAPTPPENKKSRWDSVLTYTPVVLTVLATLLAGQSSTQMSLAQYHRALAAQQQAKAGDQWSFFQAKRIRGENFETSADLANLEGGLARVDATRLSESLEHLSHSIKQLEQSAERLRNERSGKTEPQVGRDGSGASTTSDAERLLESIRRERAEVDRVRAAMRELQFGEAGEVRPKASTAFRYLNPPFPAWREGKLNDPALQATLEANRGQTGETVQAETKSDGKRALDSVLAAIRERRTDVHRMPELAAIDVRTLERTLATVADAAATFDKWSAETDEAIESVAELVRRAASAAGAVNRAVGDAVTLTAELADVPDETRSLARTLVQKNESMRSVAEQIARDILVGRHAFTAWRYEIEARYNQSLAENYEVRVLKSSAESGRYLKRSWGYFYAQLAVQAAVTVATLALAVRQRNALWGLACGASLIALVYAGAVLLDAVPVPGV
jgi:hypothetical protein